MADDFQQLPILPTAPLMRVTATDPDAGRSGDGHLPDQPGKRPTKKGQSRHAAATRESQAAAINPSVLLHDEANLTRSARTIMGKQPAPLLTPVKPAPKQTPAENPTDQPPAPPEHIHFTA